jgi:hypothetical protein
MFTYSRIVAVLAIALLAAGSTLAGDRTAVQGTLLGDDGKPFGGAQIRAQRTDAKAKPVIALTKSDGHYHFIGLSPGAYIVTAYVDGVAMSRASIQTRTDGWVKVDFDLRRNTAEADRMQQDMRWGDGNWHIKDNGTHNGFGR